MIMNFKRLDHKITSNNIKDAIFGVDNDEVIRAFNETERKCQNNHLEYFNWVLKKKPARDTFEENISPPSGSADVYKDLFGNAEEL